MDLTRLNNEYTQYWSNNDLNKAINNLREIDFYLSQGHYDTWVNTYDNLLKPPYLAGLYNQLNGTSFENIQNHISYIQLLENFRNYVSNLIAESHAIDELAKQRLQELNNDWFSNIANAIEGFTKSLGNSLSLLPYVLIGGLGFYIFFKLIKK